jgi:hypothetical protein
LISSMLIDGCAPSQRFSMPEHAVRIETSSASGSMRLRWRTDSRKNVGDFEWMRDLRLSAAMEGRRESRPRSRSRSSATTRVRYKIGASLSVDNQLAHTIPKNEQAIF